MGHWWLESWVRLPEVARAGCELLPAGADVTNR